MEKLPVQIRRATRRDVPLITSSWLKSFRDGYMVRGIPNNTYYYNHHKILEALLPRGIVLVACNEEDPNQILGWCCAEVVDTALVIHYIYVKHPFRKFHIATKMVNLLLESEKPPAVIYTHKTVAAKNIIKDKELEWLYNPYLVFQVLGEEEESHAETTDG